jgi:hypothetical protein
MASGAFAWLKRHWPKIYFVAGLCVACFLYGMATIQYQVFPFHYVRQAKIAYNELVKWAELYEPKPIEQHPHIIELGQYRPPEVEPEPAACQPGHTFLALWKDGQFRLLLVDFHGRTRHQWHIPEEVFRKMAETDYSMERGHYQIQGAHLYRDGSVAFNVEFVALVKLDRDSNLLWMLPKQTHHSVLVEPGGDIWAPSRRYHPWPDRTFAHLQAPYIEDLILRVSPEGEVLETISLLEAIYRGRYQGALLAGAQDYPELALEDPTHLNDVKPITPALARRIGGAPGDLMVSMRTNNTIAVIDRRTGMLRWSLRGPFLRQHDPDMTPRGTLVIFDNRTEIGQHNEARYITEPQSFGYSRVIELDPCTQEVLWEYTGSPERPFYSSINGKQQVLANGNLLITETEAGRAFEVTRDGRIVWEYVNRLRDRQRGDLLGRVTGATRVPPDYTAWLGGG